MLKFKKGDICCINGNSGGHGFENGELVTILECFEEPKDTTCQHYKVETSEQKWYVDECDLEIFNNFSNENV